MKKLLIISLLAVVMFSCKTRVEPNHYGVLMENFGKKGKEDYSLQLGRVYDYGRSRQLWQVPKWEQRASFEKQMNLLSADNTSFTSIPSYSYQINERRVVDVVFNNAQLGNDNFMTSLENNVLETRIYDIMKDISRKYPTDTLMAVGGNMRYENEVKSLVFSAFDSVGITLRTFTAPLVPTDKVKDKIDARNEVNSNLAVLDQQILEQKKKNELADLKAQENINLSKGLTPEILQKQFLETWKEVKQPLYGAPPVFLKQTQ